MIRPDTGLRELREHGYEGGYTAVTDVLRELSSAAACLRDPFRDAARRSSAGRGLSCTRTCRRFCAVRWRPSTRSGAFPARSFTTA